MFIYVSKTELFSKRDFLLQIVPLEESNLVSTVPTDFFWQKPKKVFTQYPKLLEDLIVFFRENIYFYSKSSYGNTECSFENPARKFIDKQFKSSTSKSGCDKETMMLSKNSFFKTVPLDTLNAVLTALRNFFGKKPKNLIWMSKTVEKIESFFQDFFAAKCSYRDIGWSCGTSVEFFLTKGRRFFSWMYEHVSEIEKFPNRVFCFKVFRRTRNIHFWQR